MKKIGKRSNNILRLMNPSSVNIAQFIECIHLSGLDFKTSIYEINDQDLGVISTRYEIHPNIELVCQNLIVPKYM